MPKPQPTASQLLAREAFERDVWAISTREELRAFLDGRYRKPISIRPLYTKLAAFEIFQNLPDNARERKLYIALVKRLEASGDMDLGTAARLEAASLARSHKRDGGRPPRSRSTLARTRG
jgi:hypothetical protein